MVRMIRALFALALILIPVCSQAAGNMGLKFVQTVQTDGKEGMIKQPQGITCNDSGTFIVADSGNSRLLTYTFIDDAVKGGGGD
jgi:NHL repeat